jgi:hypothetical protein
VRSAAELARLLPQGLLRADCFPELADEQVAGEVRERLDAVGLELVFTGEHYLARGASAESPEGFEPAFALDESHLAVAAALYLHLRYLPRHGRARPAGSRPTVAIGDIDTVFPYKQRKMQMLLGRLRNMHFIRRLDEHYQAGPYLYAFNEIEADERAHEALRNFRLRRHFQRYASEHLDPRADADSNGDDGTDEQGDGGAV